MSGPTVDRAPIDALRTRREIWRSLVATLRAYAAAASVAVTEPSPAQALARCGAASLSISLDFASGIGTWSLDPYLRPGDQGSFLLSEAGTVKWSRDEKPLDLAAIEWLEWLGRRAEEKPAS